MVKIDGSVVVTDPLTQSKLDELHQQLEANRRVSSQSFERMRLVIHQHKKHLEGISIANKLQLEKQAKGARWILAGGTICMIMVGVLVYINFRMQSRMGRVEQVLQSIQVTSAKDITRMETRVQDLQADQFETERKLERTRKNLEGR